ncbi:MAG: hypothetical protein ACOY3I_01155 [Verrucomicrobiota bacterium]
MKFQFDSNASSPIKAVALVCDLEDFAKFFSQPDVHLYIPKLLNRIFDSLNTCIYGGKAYWIEESPHLESLSAPLCTKFLGDGALFLWRYEGKEENTLQVHDIERLMNRLSSLQKGFHKVIAQCTDEVPLSMLPPRIRFGIAAGSVYRINYHHNTQEEYLGYVINLASRLQSYCKSIGFLASARLELPEKMLQEAGYRKVLAKNLRGFPQELVIVDAEDYALLDSRERRELFDEEIF